MVCIGCIVYVLKCSSELEDQTIISVLIELCFLGPYTIKKELQKKKKKKEVTPNHENIPSA
jgi:hypothetical protein